MKAFTLVSFFLIVINIVAIILLLKVIIVLVTNDDPKSLRDSGLQSIYAVNTLEALGQWILGHFSDLYVLLLVCFFYSITYLKNKPIFNILLLVSSMSTIVNGLFSGGRTQFIYWILVFIACFVYFKKDMSKKSKRNMMIASVAIFSLLSVYLTVVTISRFNNAFSDATEYAEGFSLLDYAGQSFLNFNDFFANYHHQNGYTLARIFPFMYDWYSATNFDLMIYKHTFTIDIGVFSTFLGDFYLDIGILGIAIYTIWYLAAVVFTQRTYIPNSIKFQQVLLLFLLYQIPLNGIFYYSLYNKTAVISIFATIFIALIFKFSEEETIEVSERPSD